MPATAEVTHSQDLSGVVHLTGRLTPGDYGDVAFTLPVGRRPAETRRFAPLSVGLSNQSQLTRLTIYPTGEVVPDEGGNGGFYLDGVSFPALSLL